MKAEFVPGDGHCNNGHCCNGIHGKDFGRDVPRASAFARALLSGTLVLLTVLLPAAGTPRAAGADYVEVLEGDMPLLFAAGHGGWKEVGVEQIDSPGPDPLLREYLYQVLMVRIYERTGHLPYVVYQQGHRDYVNTNKQVGDPGAYHPGNAEARAAYLEFHNQIDAMIAHIERKYGANKGLLINPHTTDLTASRGSRPWDRIVEIGFIASVTNLGSTANTMKALYDRRGEAALRGVNSIPYQWFHGQDWPSSSAVWPAAATVNSKALARTGQDVWHVLPAWVTGYDRDNWTDPLFNGAWTALYHGTNTWGRRSEWPNGLDAFQMEVNYTRESGIALDQPGAYQLDEPFTTALMDDLIDAILYALRVNYNWRPGGVPHAVIVDNGDAGFGTTGPWAESEGEGAWGTPSVFTVQYGATATWRPDLAQAGTYQVLVRWTNYGARTDSARYMVYHAGGSQSFSMDQSGEQDGKWVSLGRFRFDAGTGGRVVLQATDALSTCADAMMFRPIYGSYENTVYLPAVLRNH